jgi:DNA polymerase-3 subunit alpha
MLISEFTDQFESLKVPILGVRLPTFVVEDRFKKELGLSNNISNIEFLTTLCREGFKKLGIKKDSKEFKLYGDRIKYELGLIDELGFTDYVLIIWDIINFAKINNIPVGMGRGSAAGSCVLFLIGVTKIDSIKYGLFFERFISKIRAKKSVVDGVTYLDGSLIMDCDLDICYYRRPEILKYIEEKYYGKTCKILTFNSLSSKLVIKEVGKIFGMKSEEDMTQVTGLIPKIHGQLHDLDKAYDEVKEFKEWCDENKEIYDISLKLKDLIKNSSVHASGILISYDKLEDSCPTQLTTDKELVSSYDMNMVSLLWIKVDVLGLRGVSVVDDICKSLNIKPEDIDLTDPFIYENLQNLKSPMGIFQLEADFANQTTQKIKPHNFDQLSAILALARPGAYQFIDQYAKFVETGEFQSIHPFFDDILKETAGVAIYQEQLMQMAHKIGFTLDEAEVLRRIVGKKKLEEVKSWKQKIEDKVKENNLDPAISGLLWKILEQSASYSFNKCLGESTVIETETQDKMLWEVKVGDKIRAFDKTNNKDHYVEVLDKVYGEKELFEVELEDGRKIECSMEHKFMCEDKIMRPLKDILSQNHQILTMEHSKKN